MGDDTSKAESKPEVEGEAKTAQPFSEDNSDSSYPGMTGGEPKPRPDDVGDPRKASESGKVTQRQE